MESQICTKCNIEKPLSEFHFANKRLGERQSICRTCYNARSAAWRAAHPEQNRAVIKAWQAAHPEEVHAYQKTQYQRHRLKRLAKQAIGRKIHPEKNRAIQAASYQFPNRA